MRASLPRHELLIERLQDAALYDHPVTEIELLETHISWVLLTGPYAYKLKKPVDFGFVDFTTLDKRRHYCREELRLNRRLAPELYLAVVAITGSAERPEIDGMGPAIEYAVKMRQFLQDDLLDRWAVRGDLSERHIDAIAETVAAFHRRAQRAAADTLFGEPVQVKRWAQENFEQLRPLLGDPQRIARLDALRDWTQGVQSGRHEDFWARKTQGFVRECHGDMHLGNMAFIDGRPTIFDCIEFNEELRWIDVMSETAFLVMDLHDRARPALAHRLLDRYLMHTGDYAGVAVLPYYLVYRALVRAKVHLLRMEQGALRKREAEQARRDCQGYIDWASAFSAPRRPSLVITHGLSGSGKSALAAGLVRALGAVCIRSDVERKRLFELAPEADSGSALHGGIYVPEATRLTYARMLELAEPVLKAGFSVILDAAFLNAWQRDLVYQQATRLGVDALILDVRAPLAVLRERVKRRQQAHADPSEAGLAVLESQARSREPLTAQEQAMALTCDTTTATLDELLRAIRTRVAG